MKRNVNGPETKGGLNDGRDRKRQTETLGFPLLFILPLKFYVYLFNVIWSP